MNELIRTFICIELPQSLKARLESLISELRRRGHGSISWVKPANMHLTLRFLGDVSSDSQAEVRASAERATARKSPFTIVASGTGSFPNARNPRVFWVGIKNAADELIPLQKRIESELEAGSFGKADKPFSPHLTIGRARQPNAGRTAEALSEIGFPDEPFVVEEIIVMRSDLRPTGPIYSRLASIKLTG